MKTRFIVNPHSGGAARALPAVRAFAAQTSASVVLTERPRHATELAERALHENCELIVAVGGDGTLNEVARALVATSTTFGLVPCGSGNGLGRHLGIHGSVTQALDILRTGHPRLIDTGLAAGQPFFTAAGLGFEAEVAARFNRLPGRGFPRYLLAAAALLRTYRAQQYRIEHHGQSEAQTAFTLAVANSEQYGNGASIAPGASVTDGQLNLTIVPRVTAGNALPLAVRLFAGTLGRSRGVVFRKSPSFVIERLAPGLIHVDGETHPAGPRVEFSVRPNSLRILVPSERSSL